MSKRLIYEEDAIDELVRWGKIPDYSDKENILIGAVIGMLSALPSAQPRMKGKWVRKESDLSWWYECSECGESPLFDPYEHEVRSPFCPWCGARMEEEEDG